MSGGGMNTHYKNVQALYGARTIHTNSKTDKQMSRLGIDYNPIYSCNRSGFLYHLGSAYGSP